MKQPHVSSIVTPTVRRVGIGLGLGLVLAGSTQGQMFENNSAIQFRSFPDTALPFPAEIVVSGLGPELTSITIDLRDYSHTASYELQIAVQSPTGTSVLLMGQDSGWVDDLNLDITFDDAAADPLPSFGPLNSQSYQPTSQGSDLDFSSPGPAVDSWTVSLSSFIGEDPNGVWKLYVQDFFAGDTGSIDGGWALNLTAVPEPAEYGLAGAVGLGLFLLARRQRLQAVARK